MTGRIDTHAHAITPAYRAALERAGIDRIGGVPVPDWSPALAAAFMDAHGITTQYLSISDPGVDFLDHASAVTLARDVNDDLAELSRDDRFGAFAVLSLQDVEGACVEAARALDTLGLRGVGLMSSSPDGRYLGDPRFEPLLADLDRREAWVFVHPTAVPKDSRPDYGVPNFIAEYPFDTTRAFVSLLFNGAFDRFPAIRWHFAHGGGTLPILRKRIATLAAYAPLAVDAIGLPEGARELTADSVARALKRSFVDTALVADEPALLAMRATFGSDRIIFGSDWPFAALMYADGGDPQPELSQVFDAAVRSAIDSCVGDVGLGG